MKYQCFTKLPQISHIHKNGTFLKNKFEFFLYQLLLPYEIHGRDM